MRRTFLLCLALSAGAVPLSSGCTEGGRALVILQVRSGALTAKEGAERLGVSRKTYYEWEEKSLRAMALALENRPTGRPPVAVDEEKETLRERIQELEKKLYLAEQTIEVKEILAAYGEFREKEAKKNR